MAGLQIESRLNTLKIILQMYHLTSYLGAVMRTLSEHVTVGFSVGMASNYE